MKTYFIVLIASVLAACAIPYKEPFPVDPGTAQWRDRYIRGF